MFLTFRVIGDRGEGAVVVLGFRFTNIQMVAKGILLDDGSSYICQ